MLLHYVPPRLMFDLKFIMFSLMSIIEYLWSFLRTATLPALLFNPNLKRLPEFKKRPNPLFAGKPHFWNIRNSVEVNVEKFKEQLLISSKGSIFQYKPIIIWTTNGKDRPQNKNFLYPTIGFQLSYDVHKVCLKQNWISGLKKLRTVINR